MLLAAGIVGIDAPAYAAVSGVTVTPSSTIAGASTSYTISFTATSGLTGTNDTITLAGPSGTVFPSPLADYNVSVGGGIPVSPTAVGGGGTSEVILTTSIAAIAGASVTVTANPVSNPTTAGPTSLSVETSQDPGLVPSSSYTITPAGPELTVTGGNDQVGTVGTTYPSAFSVVVKDGFNNLISGASVTFTAPAGGASGTFAGSGTSDTVTSNGSGVATTDHAFTANDTAGPFLIAVSTSGASSVSISVTNRPAGPELAVAGGNGQGGRVGATYPSAFSVVVKDGFNNLISGASVTFTAPAGGASGTFAGGGTSDTVTSNGSGVATTDHAFTANGTAGPFLIAVSTSGASSVSISVTNTTVPGPPGSVSASGGNGSARVYWSASTSDGFSPITGYIVTASNGTQVLVASNATRATVGGLINNDSYTFTVAAFNVNGAGPAAGPTSPIRPEVTGYWLVATDGGIFSYGNPFFGSAGNIPLNAPIVGMAATPDGGGYWLVASDGGIFSYGDAGFYGSMGAKHLNAPIVAMTSTPDGGGYWLVASDGGIFSFGDARYHGSMGGKPLNAPIVGMARTPTGAGYWLVASDGGIFSFGSAHFFGSTGGMPLNKPIVGMTSPDAGGYWLVASDGGIFAYGDAAFSGSTGGMPLNKPIVGMQASKGGGYWLVASDGGIFAFGGASFEGSAGGMPLNRPVVGIAS